MPELKPIDNLKSVLNELGVDFESQDRTGYGEIDIVTKPYSPYGTCKTIFTFSRDGNHLVRYHFTAKKIIQI